MDPGSAVGISSLGIQVCQGLLSYYDRWKGYNTDITNAYDCVADLTNTLKLLKESLEDGQLDGDRKQRVKSCLQSCEEGLTRLSKKLQKLRTHEEPTGLRQKTWAEIQRARYPLRTRTLAKLREIVADIQDRLKLALQVLQLDISAGCQRVLAQVATGTRDTAARIVAIEGSIAQISTQNQHILGAEQANQFRKIVDWLSPPDPWTNHASARQRHEPQTGAWLLQSDRYQRWKTGDINHLWLYGTAGCGKTVLCSTVIEDVRVHCENATNSGYSVFYFSFSDNQKQSVEDLLRSLVVQLCCMEPGLSMLRQAYEKPNRSVPRFEELEKILLSSFDNYDEVFLLLDALDECADDRETRQNVLECIERLSQRAPSLRIFASSRELRDVRETMKLIASEPLSVATCSVDADISKWVSSQLSRDGRLCELDPETKSLIGDTISQKADGM